MGRVIGIVSLKGGVGKTSVVSALGAAISEFNKKVLLVDANFSAPNLGLHLNVVDPEVTLHDVLSMKSDIKNAIQKLDHFDLLPSSIFSREIINPLKLRDKLKYLRRNYDFTIIDSSPALNEESLAVMLASDELFVVTTPDHPTLSNTLKAVKLARQKGRPINGLILNKVYNKNFELSLDDIEKTAEVPIMAVLPYDVNFLKSLSEFTPSTIHKPNSKASIEYKKLAATLLGEKYKPFNFKELFRKITPPRQEINRAIFYERVFNQ
ncbi:MAG: AAA family ATPase [Nanoarchaeota archaeon]|nr:AAA family ATPase [Nanoarchaeota archaeon]